MTHRRSGRGRQERGSGAFSTTLGVAVIVGFLALAAHQLVGLHARSTLAAATHEAAGSVAVATEPSPVARMRADAQLRRSLGGLGEDAHVTWTGSDADHVVLTVSVPAPVLLPVGLASADGGRLEHRAMVRVERVR